MGDGGGADDQFRNGQNLEFAARQDPAHRRAPGGSDRSRIDVPPNNPFVGTANRRPEIWALACAIRFAFRSIARRVSCGPATWVRTRSKRSTSSRAARNYGWPRFEGTQLLQSGTCTRRQRTAHTADLPVRSQSRRRGHRRLRLSRRADRVVDRRVSVRRLRLGHRLVARYDGVNTATNAELATAPNPTSFGEDNNGEVYVVSQNGGIFQMNEVGRWRQRSRR